MKIKTNCRACGASIEIKSWESYDKKSFSGTVDKINYIENRLSAMLYSKQNTSGLRGYRTSGDYHEISIGPLCDLASCAALAKNTLHNLSKEYDELSNEPPKKRMKGGQ